METLYWELFVKRLMLTFILLFNIIFYLKTTELTCRKPVFQMVSRYRKVEYGHIRNCNFWSICDESNPYKYTGWIYEWNKYVDGVGWIHGFMMVISMGRCALQNLSKLVSDLNYTYSHRKKREENTFKVIRPDQYMLVCTLLQIKLGSW